MKQPFYDFQDFPDFLWGLLLYIYWFAVNMLIVLAVIATTIYIGRFILMTVKSMDMRLRGLSPKRKDPK